MTEGMLEWVWPGAQGFSESNKEGRENLLP